MIDQKKNMKNKAYSMLNLFSWIRFSARNSVQNTYSMTCFFVPAVQTKHLGNTLYKEPIR